MALSTNIVYLDDDNEQIEYDDRDPLFYDTETCGLYGMAVLIQFAIGNGPVQLYSIWKNPVVDTLRLIKCMMQHEGGLVGFNLAFDHFHLTKIFTVFSLIPKSRWHEHPEDMIDLIGELEPDGRFGPALKPVKCLDLMMHARKGPYQVTMDRSDIRLRRIPSVIAHDLAEILTQEILLDDVLFARKKDSSERWKVYDIKDEDEEIIPDFKDVCLKFAPSSALKALAKTAGVAKDKRLLYTNIEIDKRYNPVEYGYAPWALAHEKAKPGDWNKTWPMMIQKHIDHWHYRKLPRIYATDDVHDTRGLFHHFHETHIVQQFGAPVFDDDDSILACMVASVRWRGFPVDIEGIEKVKARAQRLIDESPYNFNSTNIARNYLIEVMDPVVQMVLTDEYTGKISTQKAVLQALAKQKLEDTCEECFGEGTEWDSAEPCKKCGGEGTIKQTAQYNECDQCARTEDDERVYDTLCTKCRGVGHYVGSTGPLLDFEIPHPGAVRAKQIIDYRNAGKEIELYNKILRAGRFHASFKVIGTLSGRMAGADKLNAQGIKSADYVRNKFPLSDDGWILCGGDFDGFEVALMEAAYSDPKLREDLMSGKKMHGLFGMHLFPGHTYEQICATKELPGQLNLYGRSKTGVFAVAYGGTEHTLVQKVGIDINTATDAYQSWCNSYTVWGEKRMELFNKFCSMRQPGGEGTKVEWHEPADRIVSMFGFPRYFTLEMDICKKLFDMANKPPKHWKDHKVRLTRRDREQTAEGATRSALFGAAFGVQSGAMRAAANHVIQSSGATLTKAAQAGIWKEFQPAGIHEFMVIPMNIHDEIMCPTKPVICESVQAWMNEFIKRGQEKVPLLAMKWKIGIPDWSDKDSDLIRYNDESWKRIKYNEKDNTLVVARGGHKEIITPDQIQPMVAIVNGERLPVTMYDDMRKRACIKGPDNYKWYKEDEEFEWAKT